ncbi:MAG: DoxX family membrane protein [Chloroflexi bacterium CFX4]|nr:DoxX family membrane protein [Chloroflexi bacterium CFX4]MDL1921255.1 DoxX family membrane protein [Chloroflexi bacterium CFX3]
MSNYVVRTTSGTEISDPPLARLLFSDTRFSVVWLVVRVLLGWTWLQSGWGKLGNPAWMDTGVALKGFWERAVVVPTEGGRPVIAFDWYREFLQGMLNAEAYIWFAKLIAIGETAVGIALIVGAFVGIAAFFGAFMNWNFIMAGTASTNALLFAAAILLVLAWKTAGWWGADRFLLPRLGTPWTRTKGGDGESGGSSAATGS